MTILKYILKSLKFYKKQHIAVFFGTLISTAILTGALIIGDSVRFTLKDLVTKRLGNSSFALVTADRFVRAELADEISKELNIKTASLLVLQGIATNSENQSRINTVQVLGIDERFWEISDKNMPELNANEAIISTNVAKKLNLNVDDEFLLRVQNAEIIPLNAPFVDAENPSIAIRLTIKAIADDNNLGRFSLQNIQTAPFNIFVSRNFLAEKLELPELSNLILTTDNDSIDEVVLNNTLKKIWKLADAGLSVKKLDSTDIYQLSSERIFIDNLFSEKITKIEIPKENILTYFVNSLRVGENETPYSFVTATSNVGQINLSADEIIINNWLAEDLNAKTGDSIELKYFVIGNLRTLEEKSKKFIIKTIIPIQDSIFSKTLMPSFPGLSEAGNCSDWETSIPIDLEKIRDKDEEYWENYRGTPKALISIETGLELWSNKFGNYTAIRFEPENQNLSELENSILEKISPTDINLTFQNINYQSNIAASNGVDFGELFISLSFFVIAAALLLTILIYILQTESRMSETGVLSALGFSKRKIIAFRFSESLFTVFFGCVFGGFAGILYNYLLINGLNSIWHDAVNSDMLLVYINPYTILTGIISGILISLLSIYFITRKKLKKQIVSIIKSRQFIILSSKNYTTKLFALIGIIGSLSVVLFGLFFSAQQKPTLFLLAGTLFMVGSIAIIQLIINPGRKKLSESLNIKIQDLRQLALKNAGRNKGRSLTVIILLAIGTFTIIVTGANRETFSGTENQRNSGTGGFLFWAETSMPILFDLNTLEGKKQYGFETEEILKNVNFIQFHGLRGDDASCLNLNQVQKPKILGVNPSDFDSRGAFSFAKLLNKTENPWLELNKNYGENLIPAFADQTVIQWGLLKKIGDTLTYFNENGKEMKLILVGGLKSSIFQGNILISDSIFMKNFPSASGSKTMLIESDFSKYSEIAELLNKYLSDYGIEMTLASERLARFYSVSNTYLAVFMLLGGLGVILGTFGLGIVLLRNMQDRKHEIALLIALGFRQNQIFKLIIIENLFLLISGIFIGTFSALIGILPSLFSSAYDISGGFMFILVLLVFISGLVWIYFPARFAIRKNFIADLKND